MASFEEAKQYLQKECKDGNLYDHLSEVLMKVLAEKPEDALGLFENLSTIVKQQTIAPAGSEGATHDQDPEGKAKQLEWTARSLALFKVRGCGRARATCPACTRVGGGQREPG
jgi:radial spoke head protein 4A